MAASSLTVMGTRMSETRRHVTHEGSNFTCAEDSAEVVSEGSGTPVIESLSGSGDGAIDENCCDDACVTCGSPWRKKYEAAEAALASLAADLRVIAGVASRSVGLDGRPVPSQE
jgi:hypothetical protein